MHDADTFCAIVKTTSGPLLGLALRVASRTVGADVDADGARDTVVEGDGLRDAERVCVALTEAAAAVDSEGVAEIDEFATINVGVTVRESEDDADAEGSGVVDGDAPIERDAVGVTVPETEAVGVPVLVCVPVTVELPVTDGVPVSEGTLALVDDGLAPAVIELVGVLLIDFVADVVGD